MFIRLLSFVKRRLTMPFFVLLLLSGCGQLLPFQSPQQLPTSIRTANTPSTSKQPSLGTSIAFDLGGWIHVQSASGFTCGGNAPSGPPGLLTFSTTRPTYDQGTLQSVQNYVTTLIENPGDLDKATYHRDTVPYPAFSADPSTFQLVAVSNVNYGCDEILHITNIRKTPIQIMPVSVTFTADTQTNHLHYHLIEGCSLVGIAPGCGGQSGGQEDEYDAEFLLHPGKTNTIISATITGGLISSLTLQPGEVAKVILSYRTSPSGNFSFALMPSFALGLPGEPSTTYPVPQLQETFAFARSSQFSCYDLQGQQFTEVSASLIQNGAWCI